MLCGIETKDATAVRKEIVTVFRSLFPGADSTRMELLFSRTEDCFAGRLPGYQAIDAPYHDFEHTLQGTLCLSKLLWGRHAARTQPALTPRAFESSLAAILLHDTGYLKLSHDRTGTGAKYTADHVQRSVDFTPQFLAGEGASSAEISEIQNMIRCTGLGVNVAAIPFATEANRELGYAVATADLLGQMAADDYVEKLPLLFEEFSEAVRYAGDKAPSLGKFTTAQELIQQTPVFWRDYVLRKLEVDLRGTHRLLAAGSSDGVNPFLEAVESNLSKIHQLQPSRHA